MLNRTGPLRRIIVGLSTVAALVAVGTGPAGGQAAPPTTTTTIPAAVNEVEVVDFFAEGGASYRDCEGQETPVFGGFIELSAERTGDDDEALIVPVTYSGPAAEGLVDSSDLEFLADDQIGFAFAELGPGASGTLIVTLEPGPGYVVAGDGTFEAEISDDDVIFDCNEPLPVEDGLNQTIQVGDRPEPIFDDLFEGEFGDDPEFAEFYETPVVGDLPPGLTYADDVFGGAATTPGVYDFRVRLCVDPDAPEDFASDRAVDPEMRRMQRALGDVDTPCFGTVDVRIDVLPGEPLPGPGGPSVPVTPGTEPVVPVSPPASPIPTEATFTG